MPVDDFMRNPPSTLISTKSKPYHYKDCAILLGDAAHSMVPFYGQGLNCELEDVRILFTLLLEEGVEPISTVASSGRLNATIDEQLASALDRYSDSRHHDLVAICELAMNNYVEMRHSVTTPIYNMKKALDNFLYSLSSCTVTPLASLAPLLSRLPFPPGKPRGWLPLYTMITFRPDISYAMAQEKAAKQAIILSRLISVGILVLGVVGGWVAWVLWIMLVYIIQNSG